MNTININPMNIMPAPWNTRAGISEDSVASLAESIKADGLIQAVGVYKDADGDYICFDGNRRVAAACLLGLAEIRATVFDITEEEAKIKTVTANLQREDDDPLLAANVIAHLGGDPEVIASKLGKTVSWVKRRAKLTKLTDGIKELADKLTLDALEHLSDMGVEQQHKIVKDIERRISCANGNLVTWRDIRYDVGQMTSDLDLAWFDTSACAGCSDRTGANWFANDDDGLGRCLNCACYNKRCDEFKTAKIAENIPADAPRVECRYEWNIPNEVDGKKRSKRNPCAWYVFENGKVTVKWGRTKDAIEADREAEEQRHRDERLAHNAEVNRKNEIEEKFTDWASSDSGEADIRMMIREMLGGRCDASADFVVDRITDIIADEYGCEVATIINAFPKLAELAEIPDDDAKFVIDFAKNN